MFSKIRATILFLLFLFVLVFTCFAQIFNGTNLSSSNPYYSKLPYVFEGSENYFISFETTPMILRALVPEPLIPVSKGRMTIFFAKHRIISPCKLNYYEAYFLIPVSYEKIYGGYIPVLYLNKIEAITPAREIWGYNKVGADFKFVKKNNKISITVSQMNKLIIKASFELKEFLKPPEKKKDPIVINQKYIPSVKKNAPPDVYQLTISKIKDSKTTQLRLAKATLKFFSSKYNPLDKIPIIRIYKAGYSIDSFSMTNGEVLHNYLKKR
jgi:acetoacetate decarboxylase